MSPDSRLLWSLWTTGLRGVVEKASAGVKEVVEKTPGGVYRPVVLSSVHRLLLGGPWQLPILLYYTVLLCIVSWIFIDFGGSSAYRFMLAWTIDDWPPWLARGSFVYWQVVDVNGESFSFDGVIQLLTLWRETAYHLPISFTTRPYICAR